MFALSVEELDETTAKAGKTTIDGADITWGASEGIPALAHARRFEGGIWKRFETKPTTTGWDYALMERALDASATVGPISTTLLEGRNGGAPVAADAQKMLDAHRPNGEDGFAAVDTSTVPVYFWQVSGEFAYSTGLIVTADGTELDTGFSSGEIVALQNRGPFLLVTAPAIGAFPRVFDVKTKKTLFASETARGAIFWPKPTVQR